MVKGDKKRVSLSLLFSLLHSLHYYIPLSLYFIPIIVPSLSSLGLL